MPALPCHTELLLPSPLHLLIGDQLLLKPTAFHVPVPPAQGLHGVPDLVLGQEELWVEHESHHLAVHDGANFPPQQGLVPLPVEHPLAESIHHPGDNLTLLL